MKRFTLLWVLIFIIFQGLVAQSPVFYEDFEGASQLVTSTSVKNNNAWTPTGLYHTNGLQAIMATVAPSDTTYLTTDAFTTLGLSYVRFEFNHIAKIEFFDHGVVEFSIDNGQSWHRMDDSLYEGTGLYSNLGNVFNSATYPQWQPTIPSAQPDSTWWVKEVFDLSKVVGNQSNVRSRFALMDVNMTGNGGNYGWIIDEIAVFASYSELQPPVLSFLPDLPPDTVYYNSNHEIRLHITDVNSGNNGIDSAILMLSINDGAIQPISMTSWPGDTFSAMIPFPGFGRKVSYYAKAWDGSPAHNVDSTSTVTFFTSYSPGGVFVFGNETNSSTYFGPIYRTSSYSGYDYSRYSYLIPSTELQNAGVPAGFPIEKIEWYKTTSHQSNGDALFKIYMKNSYESFLQDGTLWSDIISNATEVLNDTALLIPGTIGWITFPVSPFVYLGGGLEISTDWDISTTSSNPPTSGAFEWRYSDGLHQVYTLGQGNQAPPNSLMGTTYGGNVRPNMRISLIHSGPTHDDMGVYAVTSPMTGILANQSYPITVSLMNYGNDTIHAGSIYWQLNGVAQTPVSLVAPVFPGIISQAYTLGNINLPAGNHHIKIWTHQPNGMEDFNTMNDTMDLHLQVCNSLLSGNYSIGGSNPDFASISDAVHALNHCGISGSVEFNIAPGIYSEQISLGAVPGASASNTVTFKSANSDSTSVEIRHQASNGGDNFLLRLINCQYITFKQLTFSAMDTSFSRIVEFINAPSYISFYNNIFKVSGASITENENRDLVRNTGGDAHHLLFQSNHFIHGSTAIIIQSSGINSDSLSIAGNIFENNASTGIDLIGTISTYISENSFSSNLSSELYQAIILDSCLGSPLIEKNNIVTTATQNGYGISILNGLFDSLQPAIVANNFVRLNVNSSSNTISCGILNYQSRQVKVVFNNIFLAGNQANSGAITLFDHTPVSEGVALLNNIITSNAGGYLILVQDVDTSKFQSDYNNFYKYSGSKFNYLANNLIGYSGWQNATAGDLHSDTLNPLFLSSTDLHVNNSLLNGRGFPISGIVDDIDGDLRHSATPDIGADEFDPSGFDLACLGVLEPESGCGLTASETVVIRIKNVGLQSVSGFTAAYQINHNTPVVETVTATIAPGDTLDYPFSTTANFLTGSNPVDSMFNIHGWVAYAADLVKTNDTTNTFILSGFTPAPPTFTNVTIPYGQSVNLTAQSPWYVHWWNSINSPVPVAIGTNYQTNNLYDTTTFYLSSRVGAGLDTIQIGTGSAVGEALPIEPYYGYSYSQSLYQPGYFNGKKGWINSVWYQYTSGVGYGPDAIRIYMSNVNKTQFVNDSDWVPGTNLTMVYDGNLNIPAGTGWIEFPLSTPYYYNGIGSLVIAFEENTQGYHNSNDDFYCSQLASSPGSLYFFDDNLNPDPLAPPTGYTSTYTPNIRLAIDDKGCFSERVPLEVVVTGIPTTDAGVESFVSPPSYWSSGVPVSVRVLLKNYGLNNITSAKIIWELNNTIIDTVIWTGNLASNATDTVTLNVGYSFPGGMHSLVARSILPNNIPDPVASNDTAQFVLTCCMSGNYTIGDTITGNADYGSFNGAVAALKLAGICGNIVFQVAPGVYTEQLLVEDLNLINQNHLITFQGVPGDSTAVSLVYSATSSTDNYTLNISNSSHVVFKHMHIKALGTSNGGVVLLSNNASNNLIESCLLESSVATVANMYIVKFDQASRNIIRYSTLKNCHTALQFLSDPQTPGTGNQIVSNVITGFRSYGIYAYYEDSLIIRSNTFQSIPNAIGYGLRLQSLGSDVKIINNKILLTPSASIHAIYNNGSSASSSARSLIANNFIVISSGTSTTSTGIYSLNATHYDYYHNSVHITSGVTSGRGIFITQNTPSQNCNFINNIIRVPNGYGAYINSSDGIGLMDYNVYFTNAGNKFYVGANKTTFAAYLAANSKESHSLFYDPDFTSTNDLHLTTTYLRSFGYPLSSVMFDIDDEPRGSAMVAPGADEPPIQAIDLGVVNIMGVPDTTFQGSSYQLQAVVMNFGVDTVHQFDVSYQINNGVPVTYAVTTPLPPYQTATYIVPSFVSGAGAYALCASTIVNGDTNVFNDTYCTAHFGVAVKDAEITRILPLDEYCGMTYDTMRVVVRNTGIDTINSTGQPPVTLSYRSNNLPVVTEPFTAVIPPGDSVLYQFAHLVYVGTNNFVDSVYQISSWISYPGDSDPVNDTAYTSVTAVHVPATPLANSPVFVPFGTSVTLTAASPSADTLFWYDQPLGTKIGSGSSYTTPVMTQSDTFFVQAGFGVSILPGSLPTLYAGGNSYLGTMFNLQAINQITIDSFQINAQSSDTVEVWYRPGSYVGHTTSSAGWTLLGKHAVISAGSGNPTSLPVGGLTIPAGQTYGIYVTYKTGSNALNYTNGNGSNQNYQNSDLIFTSGHAGGYFSATSSPRVFNGTIHYHQEIFSTTSCLSDFKPIEVIPMVPVSCDVGVVSILSPDSAVFLTDEETVTVSVYNYGLQSQTNFPISYRIDQGPIVTENFNLVAFPSAYTQFTFVAKADLSSLAPHYNITAFTGLNCDTVNLNDTASVVVAPKNYCVCKSNDPLYEDIVNVTMGSWSFSSNPTGQMYSDFTQVASKPELVKMYPTQVSVTTGVVPPNGYPYPGWVNIFIDYNQDGDFHDAGELIFSKQATASSTIMDTIIIPNTAFSGVTRMRVVFREYGNHLNTGPCGVYDFGETEDYYVRINNWITQDAGISEIANPLEVNTEQSQPLVVKLVNYGSDTIHAVDINVQLNTDPVQVHSISQAILPLSEIFVNLGNILLEQGHNNILVYTVLPNDANNFNDTLGKHLIARSFRNLPYFDDFEGADYWIADTTSVTWNRGTPSGIVIDSAYSPVIAWISSPDSIHSTSITNYLYSPQFTVLNGVDSLNFSFYHQYHTESGVDRGYIQLSVDSGYTWFSLGYMGYTPSSQWYNSVINGISCWSGNSGGWIQSSITFDYGTISVGSTGTLMFRFVFQSNSANNNYEGWAIDNFELTYPQKDYDAGVAGMMAPSGAVMLGSTQNVEAVIVNYGLQPLTQIPVAYSVNGANWITEFCSPSTPLPPGDSVVYLFSQNFIAPASDFQLCVRSQLSNDAYSFNDQFCFTIQVIPPMVDAGLKRIVFPVDTTFLGVNYDPVLILVNDGQDPLLSATLEYKVDNGSWISESWNGLLQYQDSTLYTFNQSVTPPSGPYNLSFRIIVPGDPNPANDTLSVNLLGLSGIFDQEVRNLSMGSIYPNPADDCFWIPVTLEYSGSVLVKLSDALGQTVQKYHIKGMPGRQLIKMEASSLPQGIYFCTLTHHGRSMTRKVVIRR